MPLKAAIFFDDAHFEQEKTSFYFNAPQPVAFSAEIPSPNSYLALEVLNIPILLVRNKDGILKPLLTLAPIEVGNWQMVLDIKKFIYLRISWLVF